jgi:hypothetical protein
LEFTDYTFGDRAFTKRTESKDENDNISVELSFSYKRKLANILFDIYFPKPLDKEYYHYTKISALRQILKGEIILRPLLSNENYHEFVNFYNDHKYLGYFNNRDYNGALMKDSLMKEIYAFCLTTKNGLEEENEKTLWSSFADNGHGVRIEFEINSKHPDFKKIFYLNKNINKQDLPINKIKNSLWTLYEREFYIPGISKFGAFYLPGMLEVENEVRFVIKRHTDEYEFNVEDLSNGFIKIPFKSIYGEFVVKKIKIGSECSESEKQQIMQIVDENGYTKEIIEM